MTYADSLLTANENVVYRTRKHWLAPVVVALPASAITLGGILVLVLHSRVRHITFIGPATNWVGWLAILVGVGWLIYSFMRWYTMEYVVTNRKVIKAWGMIRKSSDSASLEKINEISMQQSLLGRLLNFGTLQVRTASDMADLRYWFMRDPQMFRRQILEAKQQFELADAHYIARAVTGAAPAKSAASPEAAAEQADESARVPELISQLAKLRDQGVLTESEFQTKKAELLGRL